MIKILLVDDSNTIRLVCAQILKQTGHQVRTSSSAESGLLDIVKHGVPDLVITDIELPGMDGMEFCKRLRDAGVTVPILVMTSYSSKEMVQLAKTLNVSDWLIKPVTPEDLIKKTNLVLTVS